MSDTSFLRTNITAKFGKNSDMVLYFEEVIKELHNTKTELVGMTKARDALHKENDSLAQELRELAETYCKVCKELDVIRLHLNNLLAENDDLSTQVEELEEEKSELKYIVKKFRKADEESQATEIVSDEPKIKLLQNDLAYERNLVSKLRNDLFNANDDYDRLHKEFDDLVEAFHKQEVALTADYVNLRGDLFKANDLLETRRKQMINASDTISDLNKQLAHKEEELAHDTDLKQEIKDIADRLTTIVETRL